MRSQFHGRIAELAGRDETEQQEGEISSSNSDEKESEAKTKPAFLGSSVINDYSEVRAPRKSNDGTQKPEGTVDESSARADDSEEDEHGDESKEKEEEKEEEEKKEEGVDEREMSIRHHCANFASTREQAVSCVDELLHGIYSTVPAEAPEAVEGEFSNSPLLSISPSPVNVYLFLSFPLSHAVFSLPAQSRLLRLPPSPPPPPPSSPPRPLS